jgi:hypothetical protein
MDWKQYAPYLVPLLVMGLLARRVMKAQQARPVKAGRLWIYPVILIVLTGMTLSREPAPTMLVILAFTLAAIAGGALGWFRVHTLEFSVDPETNTVHSKASPLGAILLVGLLLFRQGLNYVLKDVGVHGADLLRWTDGALIFTAVMFAAQSAHTWVKASKLMPAAGSVEAVAPPKSAE